MPTNVSINIVSFLIWLAGSGIAAGVHFGGAPR